MHGLAGQTGFFSFLHWVGDKMFGDTVSQLVLFYFRAYARGVVLRMRFRRRHFG